MFNIPQGLYSPQEQSSGLSALGQLQHHGWLLADDPSLLEIPDHSTSAPFVSASASGY